MKSTLVNFSRPGGMRTGSFQQGDEYTRTIGTSGGYFYLQMSIDQRQFEQELDKLRYRNVDEDERLAAIKIVSEIASDLLLKQLDEKKRDDVQGHLQDELSSNSGIQQLDIVPSPPELAMIPFEGALLPNGLPLFLYQDGVAITRRVRGSFQAEKTEWPSKPRVLFVWSEGGGGVPHEKHLQSIYDALEPWMPPEQKKNSVFVEVKNASLADLETAVKDGRFTHIHLLAHGGSLSDKRDERFGISFRDPVDDSKHVVSPEKLVRVLSPQLPSAMTITIAACDGGYEVDSVNPKKSLAHELHVAGFPVVVASQLPLTKAGSCELAEHFFEKLFDGRDVRQAIHRVREKLYKNPKETGHDWISLVSYVELPEGYDDILERVHLDSTLAALKNLRDRTEAMKDPPKSEVQRIKQLFETRINSLKDKLADSEQKKDDPNIKEWLKDREEHLGLIGSAEKRVAEFIHFFQEFDEPEIESRTALERSRNHYLEAFKGQPSHHWSGVQYLAIDAALTGKVNKEHWTTAYRAAEVARCKSGEYWALGSLAELALLSPIAGGTTDETADVYLEEMKHRVSEIYGNTDLPHDPFHSTTLQFLRYKNWWKKELGYFPETVDLSDEAARLVILLQSNYA